MRYGRMLWDNDDRSVTFEQVSFSYNPENTVLDKISFQIESGEHVLIEERTESGKSTILQLIAGYSVLLNTSELNLFMIIVKTF